MSFEQTAPKTGGGEAKSERPTKNENFLAVKLRLIQSIFKSVHRFKMSVSHMLNEMTFFG